MSNILVDNATLLQHIKELLLNGKRGTLFITTDHNQSVTLAFENGVVTGISSRGLVRGIKALEHLVKIERASYKFDDNVMLVLPGGTPHPDDVSRILDANIITKCSTDFYGRATQVIEEHLKEAIGPYAIIVMSEFCALVSDELDTIEKAEAAVRKLAEEIDSPTQAQLFIQAAVTDLTKLYKSVI